jgi:hypothetical protein
MRKYPYVQSRPQEGFALNSLNINITADEGLPMRNGIRHILIWEYLRVNKLLWVASNFFAVVQQADDLFTRHQVVHELILIVEKFIKLH